MTVFPPYNAGYRDGWFYNSGDAEFGAIVDSSAYNSTGELNTFNQNRIRFPGDSAGQKTFTSANMQIYFQSPVSGLVTIVATVGCGDSYYYGSLDDESGWSNARIKQFSQLEMWIPNVIDGNSARYPLVDYSRGGDGGQWGPHLTGEAGVDTQFRYVPNATFTAGQWVLLEMAIWDEQDAWVNDMQFHGEIKNSWIIRQLDIT
jgi:hypothetical protein